MKSNKSISPLKVLVFLNYSDMDGWKLLSIFIICSYEYPLTVTNVRKEVLHGKGLGNKEQRFVEGVRNVVRGSMVLLS